MRTITLPTSAVDVVALCVSAPPRPCLADVVRAWRAQSEPVPLMVHTQCTGWPLGALRDDAMRRVIDAGRLGPSAWVILLDDDDDYSPTHAAAILDAIRSDPGAVLIAPDRFCVLYPGGIQDTVGVTQPHVARHVTVLDPGMGTHSACAVRVGAYLAAGGYPLDATGLLGSREDVQLYLRLRALPGARVTYYPGPTMTRRLDRPGWSRST